MFTNYVKTAIRNLLRYKAYSIINILGLAVGLTACIFVGLYIKQDLSYDKFHENGEHIYRVAVNVSTSSSEYSSAETPALVAPTLKNEYPEIERISRIYFSGKSLVQYGDKKFYEDDIIYADQDFFEMFSFKTILGEIDNPLIEKNTIVLTESAAAKYFGNSNPLGEVITIDTKHKFTITGIIADVPNNSHFNFDFAATYSSLKDYRVGGYIDQWGATFGSYTYILLNPETNPQHLLEKCSSLIMRNSDMPPGNTKELVLQPLFDIHLYSNVADEIRPNSSVGYIIILSSIALFILLLACINFINLSTARAAKRAKEIGVRKVLGAFKSQVIKQMLGESIIVAFLAMLIALILVEISRPLFSRLLGNVEIIESLNDPLVISVLLFGTLIVGILAGSYPAFILSYFRPVQTLKANSISQGVLLGGKRLRSILVVTQYSISIILIAVTLTINDQVKFMRDYDMGFDKEYMLMISTPERIRDNYEPLKNKISSIAGVKNATFCFGTPVSGDNFGTNLIPVSENNGESFGIDIIFVDDNYFNHFDIPLLEGRNLSRYPGNNSDDFMVVNEAMVKQLGYPNNAEVIGKKYRLGFNGYSPTIIGVVKDFNLRSLHSEVSPTVFMYKPRFFQEVVLKIESSGLASILHNIESVWDEYYSDYPFQYSFIDEDVNQLYKAEEISTGIAATFSGTALFIASLGILGLIFYTAEQKRKEIGIRKVLGAGVYSIIRHISNEFAVLLLISTCISWPLAYLAAMNWLNQFTYRVEFDVFVLILSGVIVILISLFVTGFTVIKSSLANPVDSLRSE